MNEVNFNSPEERMMDEGSILHPNIFSVKLQTMDSVVYFSASLVQHQQGTGLCQPGADLKPMKLS